MSVKSRILPVLALTATLGLSACVAHVREPGYGYYGGGYRSGYYGHSRVYSEYPRTTRVVYRRGHDYDNRDRHRDDRRRGDRDHDGDRDNDGIRDRWDRH